MNTNINTNIKDDKKLEVETESQMGATQRTENRIKKMRKSLYSKSVEFALNELVKNNVIKIVDLSKFFFYHCNDGEDFDWAQNNRTCETRADNYEGLDIEIEFEKNNKNEISIEYWTAGQEDYHQIKIHNDCGSNYEIHRYLYHRTKKIIHDFNIVTMEEINNGI